MYIKKKDQELFKQLDKNLEMPIYWNKFIKEISQKNRLIIKESKGLYFCTNCHKKFSENFKVNDYCKCPKCGNVYLVKTQKLRRYTFKQDLAILQKFENYYIVRSFAMNTFYKDSKFYNENFEYGRMIYDDKLNLVNEIVNDNVVGTISGWWISFRSNDSYKWRYYNSNRFYLTDEFMYYPYNLEELLKNFENLKYSMLWELVKHVSCNLIYLIKNYNPSIEMLTKMELYNLALCPKSFLRKNNFNERFMGLTKDYIPFIREHNLNYDELIILSKIKIKNYFIK